jgi:beta-galactosidase
MAHFGVDYYPEHWPQSRWPIDARMMREAGIGLVRMGEFSWAKMEPAEGKFDFAWLDEAIAVVAKEEIQVVLGTPTATPPAWIIERNPEILPVDHTGMVRGFGGRHHDCQSNEAYRAHIRRFVRAMARHFRGHPHVIGWQTDNELGNSHRTLCFCDSCKQAFRAWLKRRYGSIEAVNEAWGTVFWSQTYSSFAQIPVPLPTPNSHNPSLLLDWKRFCSDLIVDFQKLQIDILRAECPGQFITHNYMGFFEKTNYFHLARDLDFICHNQYPLHFRKDRDPVAPPERLAAILDLMRGIKRKPFWIMEEQAGPTGWETVSSTPRPGQLRLWTYHAVAHGADAVVYFRWRTCLFGTEQFWHGILPHSGEPGRRYDEVKRTIGELTPLMPRLGDGGQGAEVAMLFSYDQEWAFQVQPHHFDFDYITHLMTYYTALHKAHVPVDLVSDAEDFSAYKVVIAPLMFLMTPDLEAKLRQYVAGGGHLVLTMRTGVKNWTNQVVPHVLPGPLADVVGLTVDEYDCLWGVSQAVRWQAGERAADPEPCAKWCDIVTPAGARPLAVYTMDYYQGTPAITANAYERGVAYYAGTELPPRTMRAFMAHVLATAGVEPLIAPAPEGVEATRRRGKDGDYIFLLNHARTAAELALPASWKPLIGREFVREHVLQLAPYEVALCISA